MCLGSCEFLQFLVNKCPDVQIGITFPFFVLDNEAERICPRKTHLFRRLSGHVLGSLGKQCSKS